MLGEGKFAKVFYADSKLLEKAVAVRVLKFTELIGNRKLLKETKKNNALNAP